MALSFLVMIVAVKIAIESSPVGMQWLLLTYLFQTWGELALVSNWPYQHFLDTVPSVTWVRCLVLWFLASAIGGVLAGLLGGEALMEGLRLYHQFLNL
jgi:POT family proton-dependent oligopeptide transporter